MLYYITTPELASGITQIKAKQMGCTSTTLFWWGLINHPTLNQTAICITEEEALPIPPTYDVEGVELTPEMPRILYQNPLEEPVLTITADDFVDRSVLEAQGWFPEVNI